MEVILNKDIEGLGKVGSIVRVKDGYARNFLIPNRLAIPKTQANLRKIEQEKQKKSLQSEKAKNDANKLSEKLASLSLTIPVLTQEDDKLFGSVSASDIESALKEEGFAIDKNAIVLNEPIKSIGIYEVPLKIHPEVSAKIKVWVVKK